MANTTDNSTLFRIVAIAAAVIVLIAAALVFLRGSGDTSTAELAALSQSIPAQAANAIGGESGAYDELTRSVQRLAELRRATGSAAPGSNAQWNTLMSGASTVLEKRTDVETLHAASAQASTSAASIVQLADGLLDRSGSTAVMQEFQQRADRLRQQAERLAQDPTASEAAVMGDDLAFLNNVAAALGGGDSDLDVRALSQDAQDTTLAPIVADLQTLSTEVERIAGSAASVASLADTSAGLSSNAAALGRAFMGSGGESALPGPLQNPWIPLGLMVLGALLVVGLIVINSRGSDFEETAREQAQQNERNQQAILRLLDEMGSLADGDLTVEATVTEDITGTIADSFNFAIEELRTLVATVNETAIMVDSAAKQTESTAVNMAKAADNQAREINAATESIVSMAASIEEVSGNAERSSDVARHSVEVAHKGGEAVRRTIDGMNAIRETIQDTSKRIKRLGESSQEIGNIVELINDIAEQTNILALNASIQASMAGEAGRGFAVVADEVQRLAERSTNATKQIEVLVRTIQADTNEAVVSMERSTTDVVGGALLAENAGAALDEIEQVSNQIASLVQNISGSSRQQAGSAADVTRRTTRLREISEQTGKATTATAAAIAKLSELATQLRQTVAGFTLPNESLRASALSASSSNALQNAPANDQAQTG